MGVIFCWASIGNLTLTRFIYLCDIHWLVIELEKQHVFGSSNNRYNTIVGYAVQYMANSNGLKFIANNSWFLYSIFRYSSVGVENGKRYHVHSKFDK